MTIFTDPAAAVEEAVYLSEMSGRPQAIVRAEGGLTVMSYTDAWFDRIEVLETVNPIWEEVA